MITNLEYYKVFYYAAKAGSLTTAAKQLSISQPAVSQSLKQLEDQLGVSLFYRASRGIRLSPEGELLFSHVARAYEQLELGERKLAQMVGMGLGEVRIGASDMTLQFYLLPYLEMFHEKFPGIKVVVTNAPTPETINNLQNGQIDFAVVSTPVDLPHDMKAVKVKEIQDVFVAGRRFTQYKNHTLDLQTLESLPLIFLEQNTSTRSYMDKILLSKNIHVRPEFELATSDMIVQIACSGLGVGNVVRDFAQEQMEKGQLFEVKFESAIPRRHFCVVTAKDGYLSVAARKLLELMEEPRY
jgi:DNA-binding transcriptional LysR family regulator